MTPAAHPEADARLADLVRRESALITAALTRATGDFMIAEEAVADAVVKALTTWRAEGTPDRPGAWLTTVARRRAIDLLRARARRPTVSTEVLAEAATRAEAISGQHSGGGSGSRDERVGMLFACCHPSLAPEARLALSLRAVLGLTTRDIARAFFVPEATLAQRIVRAKRKIVANGIPLTVPRARVTERLDDVLTVLSVMYSAGWLEPDPASALGVLPGDALWLAQAVAESLPHEPEAAGLLALLLLQQSRAAARFDDRGNLVLLADQDRSRWDHPSIARAELLLERAARLRRPGRFQLQAAVAACHASAPTAADTDWLQILTLYDLILRFDPSPVVRLNRAVALAVIEGPAAALRAVDAVSLALPGHHLVHSTRAELLRRLGRVDEARAADEQALTCAPSVVEQVLLQRRLGSVPE